MVDGNVPVSRLFFRFKIASWFKAPISDGKLPFKALPHMLSCLRAVIADIEVGMVPSS